MCSIAGAVSKGKKGVFSVLVEMLSFMSHRGPDGFGVAISGQAVKAKSIKELRQKHLPGQLGIGHSLLSITGHGAQPFSSCDGKTFLCHNGQLYNYLELNENLGQKHSFASTSDSETILHFLEENRFDPKKFFPVSRGVFSCAVSFKDRLVAFRDVIGEKPLWFGETEEFFVFASEPQALKRIGVAFPSSLSPGFSLTVSRKGFLVKKVFSLSGFKKTVPKKASFESLLGAFGESVSLMAKNVSRAGVLFSGGIDSSVIAKAVSESVKETCLFTCGVEGSHDLSVADKTAQTLGLKLVEAVVAKDEVPQMALSASNSLFFFDKMQLGIGLPLFGACKEASKKGFRVVFSGQGSDEVFCGYSYYIKALQENGFSGVEKEIRSSLERMWHRDLFRDDALSMANSVELRLPFLETEFLRQALAVPASEKIKSPTDALRKHPVRKIGEKLGLSAEIVSRPKNAMQYGSGFARELEKLF
ncbi:MAG: asparagine synthetase B [archaeon]|nr:asparagine synthetase B [archaeon]